ncbi:MAG: transketolase [Pseudomonadota bacterium]
MAEAQPIADPGTPATGAAPAPDLTTMANAIRALSMDAVQAANSGHPGMPMGMADVATVLYTEHLRFDASAPDWINRDRFVLSAGHGSALLYALLYLTGTTGMSIDDVKAFRQLGSKTAGHPEYGHAPGIETTTGPLGQGIANAVGMALGERLLNARAGGDLIDYRTYCIAGDGCLMEGISQEAITLAGHLKLGRLIVLFDDNSISIDGDTSLSTSDDQLARFKAAGWNTIAVDGHDKAAVSDAITKAKSDESKPWLIACKTIIGYGSPKVAGTAKAHGAPLGDDEIAITREKLGWPYGPFEIPDDVLSAWRDAGSRGAVEHSAWAARFKNASTEIKTLLQKPAAGNQEAAIKKAIQAAKSEFRADEKKRATRVWSQMTLEHLTPVLPNLIGGSADLTGSNGTMTKHHTPVSAGNFAGNYIHYGVREHGMAAAMNGLALSENLIPYGGTFMVFTDYCRPAIRLSALMQQRVIYVMTHDSIGLGEDGPTHQPVEHLSALRCMPNLNVFRPADPIETAECWELALLDETRPSILALTRQSVPLLRPDADATNLCAKGAYVLHDVTDPRQVTLLSSGSETGLAIEAAKALGESGVAAAVVSVPSMERFADQPADYQNTVLGDAPRVAIEAGTRQSWDRWLRPQDTFVGMTGYGASGPAPELYQHFGLTPQRIAEVARSML